MGIGTAFGEGGPNRGTGTIFVFHELCMVLHSFA